MRADRERAAAAARDVLSIQKWTSPPIDPFVVARLLKIDVRPITEAVGFSGCLVEHGELVGIYYSTRIDNEGFRRFTVAHEIGHFELGHDTSVLSPSGAPHSSRSNFVSNDWFEEEADAFATELLLPRAMFLPRSTGKVLGISLVQRLADVFGTSLTSTAIRYAEVSPDPVIVIVSEAGRILYHFRSACVQRFCVGYLRRGDPLPAASATAHMIGRKAPSVEDSTYLSVWFEGVHYDLPFDEDALDLGRYGKTLTILHARELPDREALDAGEDDDEY